MSNITDSNKISKRAMVAAWMMEFPWIERHFGNYSIQKVMINEVGGDLLQQQSGTHCGITPMKLILFLDDNGDRIGRVGFKLGFKEVSCGFLWLDRKKVEEEVYFNESVEEAITRLHQDGTLKRVRFIVGIKTSWEYDATLFISLIPKGEDLNTLWRREVDVARRSVSKKISQLT